MGTMGTMGNMGFTSIKVGVILKERVKSEAPVIKWRCPWKQLTLKFTAVHFLLQN